jgi:hypothetical protein
MGAWSFRDATSHIAEATEVLALRDQVVAAAAAEGLTAGTTGLESAYEGAKDDLDAATSLARKDLAAVEAIAGARAVVEAAPDPVAQVGLLGETPRAGYDAAREAFEAGDADGAIAQAQLSEQVLAAAPSMGRQRLLMGGVGVLAIAGFLGMFLVLRRRRSAPERVEASGTLGAHPEALPPPPGEGPPENDGGSGAG